MRFDIAVAKLKNISRNKAAEIIKNNGVILNNTLCVKTSQEVGENDEIKIIERENFVSRSALKLLYFLEQINLDIAGFNCLDIGASTGGWTQVLLSKNALRITALDIGVNQLNNLLKTNEKVVNLEKTDIRGFRSPEKFDLVVCDASFISLEKFIEDIDKNAKEHIILLFKPQFETGRGAKRDKRGVVVDEKAVQNALINFLETAEKFAWNLIAKSISKVKGKNGNQEYLLYYKKSK
ncbi:MAG: TlyA family RNA methyltransferase [Helicobacteraceae bacterium]|jgi:23S rRNA (cytidine1920-2'-O)/16S rRNA (cytidine1409-2'-O)-methyltransferase|nr:TlyA family RNA methyltransferase [Helicobacteraceae bacterium]